MATYTMMIFIPIYAKTQLGLTLSQAFVALLVGDVCGLIAAPLFAILSDRIGRKRILLTMSAIFFFIRYPIFVWLLDEPSFGKLVAMKIIFGFLGGGPLSVALAEQFTTRFRSTGLAVTSNFAIALFGGTSPFIVTWLIKVSGSPLAPAFYLMFSSLIGFIAALFLVERYKKPLPQ